MSYPAFPTEATQVWLSQQMGHAKPSVSFIHLLQTSSGLQPSCSHGMTRQLHIQCRQSISLIPGHGLKVLAEDRHKKGNGMSASSALQHILTYNSSA